MRPPLMRVLALAAALAAGVGALASRRAAADERPLPSGTIPAVGLPPFVPDEDVRGSYARLVDWVERVAEAGAREAGTRRGTELLYSAAAVAEADPTPGTALLRRASALYVEVTAVAPEDEPLRALSTLHLMRIGIAIGNFESARAAAAWCEQRARPPVDADEVTRARWAAFRGEMATRFPVDAAAILAGLGRPDGAALRLLDLVEACPPGLSLTRVQLLERVARYRVQAGQATEADRAAERAQELATTDAERARLAFWRLHLRHGLLTRQGDVTPTGARPGPGFAADVERVLVGLAGNPFVLEPLLSSASSALMAGDDAQAFTLYLRALTDPALAERALTTPGIVDGLLAAVPAGIRLGQLDESEALLLALGRLGRPPALHAELLSRIRLAREEASRTPTPDAPDAPAPGPVPPEAHAPPPPPGLLRLPAGPRSAPRAPPEPLPAESSDGPGALPVVAALTALGAGALLLGWRMRRRA